MRKRHRANFNDSGHAHELTFSCYRGFPFLKAERTCRWLAEAIDVARESHRFDVSSSAARFHDLEESPLRLDQIPVEWTT